jgi:putative mRNA 3-end processing factor
LTATIEEVAAEEIWVTHGREEALVHYATQKSYHARALALAGFEEDE